MNIDDYKKMIKPPTLEQLIGDDLSYQNTIDEFIKAEMYKVAKANPDAKQILYRFRENPETCSLHVDFYVVPKVQYVSIGFTIIADDVLASDITP